MTPSSISVHRYSKDKTRWELDVRFRSTVGTRIRRRVRIPSHLMTPRSVARVRSGQLPQPDSNAGRWISQRVQEWHRKLVASEVAPTLAETLATAAGARANRRGERRQASKKCPTLADFRDTFMAGYLPSIRARPGTVRGYVSAFDAHLCPLFGDYRLDEIGLAEIEPLYSRPVAASTLNNLSHKLKVILGYARSLGLIAEVPEIRRLKEESRKTPDEKWWKPEELEKIRVAASADINDVVMVLLGADAGMRVSEIVTLRWVDLCFETRVITIRRNLSAGREVTPKGKRARKIPMSRRLCTALLELRRSSKDTSAHVLSDGAARWTKHKVTYQLQKLCRRAGVSAGGPHKLRHTCGSVLGKKGYTLKQIAKFLGHARAATAEIYTHTDVETLEAMATTLG